MVERPVPSTARQRISRAPRRSRTGPNMGDTTAASTPPSETAPDIASAPVSLGGDADKPPPAWMTKPCRDAGINFFVSADEYNKGRSEEILGRLAKGHRDDLVLTTKCFNQTGPDINARGSSR